MVQNTFFFFHIEECLKYCDKIKYNSYKGIKEAHYLEIGKVTSKKQGFINKIKLVSFNLAWDDPCNGISDSDYDSF